MLSSTLKFTYFNDAASILNFPNLFFFLLSFQFPDFSLTLLAFWLVTFSFKILRAYVIHGLNYGSTKPCQICQFPAWLLYFSDFIIF